MSNVKGKTLLILGAGFGQVPAIQKAIELGLNVLVVDKNPNAIGMMMVKKSFPIDIIDEIAVLNLAKENNIDGIMTMQTDLPIPVIGLINDKLKLTGVSYQGALNCSNKTQTRLKLKEKGIKQPVFEIVKSYNEAKIAAKKIGYPVIVKSADSSGSRGVTKVDRYENIPRAFKEAINNSRQKYVLVEEYIDGIEFGAQAFSVNGECLKVLLHNDKLASGKFMVPVRHSFPTFINGDQLLNTEKTIKECIKALEINNGPSNIDMIFDKRDGQAKIIEVGARIGATCLPELVEYFSGIDWVKTSILNALGHEVDLKQTLNFPVAAEILEANQDGVLREIIIPDEVKNHKNLIEIEITKKIGDKVSKLRKGTDRIGKIIVKEDSYKKAEKLVSSLKCKVIFKIEKHE
jgi:biotin carboxylase